MLPSKNQEKPEKNNVVTKIIIKSKKGGHGGAHHGGAWKVAYADFVTAMMAFFLLMWLLNSTTDRQKRGIAHYFDPFGTANESSGNRGILGGRSTMDGDMIPIREALPPPEKTQGDDHTVIEDARVTAAARQTKKGPNTDKNQGAITIQYNASTTSPPPVLVPPAPVLPKTIPESERLFQKTTEEIRHALSEDPLLKGLEKNVLIENVPQGLRLQILDQGLFAMFETGRSDIQNQTRQLLGTVAKIIEKLPYPLSITGHTDARPFQVDHGYGNWELSVDRANACRRTLIDAGIPQNRITSVIGKADTDPLFPQDPFASQNRRISIVLLHTPPQS